MPYNMAIFGLNSASKIIEKYSDAAKLAHSEVNNGQPYTHWYVGGHSLGGAMAASYAAKHTNSLDGLVLLAAYPTASLDTDGFKVVSVYGSEDGVLNLDKYSASLKYMPSDFTEYVIEGGSHTGFGSYGAQARDGVALITQEKQWRQTADVIASQILQ